MLQPQKEESDMTNLPTSHDLALLARLSNLVPHLDPKGRCGANNLIRFGAHYKIESWPEDLRRRGPRAPGRPHWNAGRLVLDYPGRFTYVEGVALVGTDEPESHQVIPYALCEVAPGVCVDPTRRRTPPLAFLGVAMPEFARLLISCNLFGPFLGEVQQIGEAAERISATDQTVVFERAAASLKGARRLRAPRRGALVAKRMILE